MHRQLGDGAVAPDCRHRHLRLERRAVLLPSPLHVLLPRYPRFLGAGLHLSHLSHFRGPAQSALSDNNVRSCCSAARVWEDKMRRSKAFMRAGTRNFFWCWSLAAVAGAAFLPTGSGARAADEIFTARTAITLPGTQKIN